MAGPDQSRPVPYGGVPDPNQPGQAVSYPAGQYPPAAGQQAAAPNSSPGYGYSPAHGGSKPPRGTHTGLIVLVVVLVVLVLTAVAGVGIYVWHHNAGGNGSDGAGGNSDSGSGGGDDTSDDAGSGDLWSSDWLNGAEKAWTLDAPSGLGGDASMTITGGKLIRMISGPDAATVTVYKLGDGEPEQLWEEEVSGSTSWITVWKNWIVVDNTLIDIDSHEHTAAPWEAKSLVTASGENAISCLDTTCMMWTSPSDKKWEATFSDMTAPRVQTSQVVGNYALLSGSGEASAYYAIDLDTGSAKRFEDVEKGEANPRALADGWIVYAGRQSHVVNLYEADGSSRETFDSGVDDRFTTYPWTPVPFTLDQARLWLKDGDVSWAPSTYSVSQADASCNSITVGDNDIDLGKENALTKGKSGSCYGTSPIQAVYHSGDGQIATFYEHNDSNEEFLHLVDMTTGQSPDPIALGDRSSFSVQGDLLIAYDRAGNATAYRPA